MKSTREKLCEELEALCKFLAGEGWEEDAETAEKAAKQITSLKEEIHRLIYRISPEKKMLYREIESLEEERDKLKAELEEARGELEGSRRSLDHCVTERNRYKEGLEEIEQTRGHIYAVEDLKEMARHHLKKVPPPARCSECGGSGFRSTAEHHPDCDMSCRDGKCPVEVPVPCPKCKPNPKGGE